MHNMTSSNFCNYICHLWARFLITCKTSMGGKDPAPSSFSKHTWSFCNALLRVGWSWSDKQLRVLRIDCTKSKNFNRKLDDSIMFYQILTLWRWWEIRAFHASPACRNHSKNWSHNYCAIYCGLESITWQNADTTSSFVTSFGYPNSSRTSAIASRIDDLDFTGSPWNLNGPQSQNTFFLFACSCSSDSWSFLVCEMDSRTVPEKAFSLVNMLSECHGWELMDVDWMWGWHSFRAESS